MRSPVIIGVFFFNGSEGALGTRLLGEESLARRETGGNRRKLSVVSLIAWPQIKKRPYPITLTSAVENAKHLSPDT